MKPRVVHDMKNVCRQIFVWQRLSTASLKFLNRFQKRIEEVVREVWIWIMELSVNRKSISGQLEYRKKIKRKEGKECWQWSGGYTIFAERQKDSSGTVQKWLRVGGYGIRNTSWWLRTMAERAAVVRKVGNDEVLQASKFWQHNLLQSPPLLSCKTRCTWSSIVSETGG